MTDFTASLLASQHEIRFVTGWRQAFQPGACPLHSHPSVEIVFHPLVGGITRLESGESYEFGAGSVFIYPQGWVHDQVTESTGEDWCVHLRGLHSRSLGLAGCLHIHKLDDAHLVSEIEDLTRSVPILDALDQAALDHRATALLIRLAKHLEGSSAGGLPTDGYCAKAMSFIQQNYQTICQLADVAEHVGISYHHLRHCFQKREGQTLSKYLTRVRIERAKAMLVHSALPLREIAEACGFANERYFSTCFRKIAGCAPGSYRERTRHAHQLPREALS